MNVYALDTVTCLMLRTALLIWDSEKLRHEEVHNSHSSSAANPQVECQWNESRFCILATAHLDTHSSRRGGKSLGCSELSFLVTEMEVSKDLPHEVVVRIQVDNVYEVLIYYPGLLQLKLMKNLALVLSIAKTKACVTKLYQNSRYHVGDSAAKAWHSSWRLVIQYLIRSSHCQTSKHFIGAVYAGTLNAAHHTATVTHTNMWPAFWLFNFALLSWIPPFLFFELPMTKDMPGRHPQLCGPHLRAGM